MSKAFTREGDEAPDEVDAAAVERSELPAGVKNYITPGGLRRLQDELRHLVREERPRVVETVAWAAGNGDRSENGDYIYGKRRLREIDHRIRRLTKRLEVAEVVDPAQQKNHAQVFFGATVTYVNGRDESTPSPLSASMRPTRYRPGELVVAHRPGPDEGARGRRRRLRTPAGADSARSGDDRISGQIRVNFAPCAKSA